MYLYFDRTGKLKEIINDEALRQGNYGVNKMYIYIDRNDVSSIDVTYLLPSTLVVGPQNYDQVVTAQIPFNDKRDLYWFKYYQDYQFIVIDLETDINGNSPLDEAGLVHCDMQMNLENTQIYTLGEVNFVVEVNAVLNQKQVANQEYMSLSNYLFLRALLGGTKGCVPYEGALYNVDLGTRQLLAQLLKAKGSVSIGNEATKKQVVVTSPALSDNVDYCLKLIKFDDTVYSETKIPAKNGNVAMEGEVTGKRYRHHIAFYDGGVNTLDLLVINASSVPLTAEGIVNVMTALGSILGTESGTFDVMVYNRADNEGTYGPTGLHTLPYLQLSPAAIVWDTGYVVLDISADYIIDTVTDF